MASFVKIQAFVDAVMKKTHNLAATASSGDQLRVALTTTAPSVSTAAVLADITSTEASYSFVSGGTSGRNVVTVTSSQTAGVFKLFLQDLIITASGGSIGPFRYVVLYNSTAASGNLIGYYDYGASITLLDAETLTIDFDGVNGVIQLS